MESTSWRSWDIRNKNPILCIMGFVVWWRNIEIKDWTGTQMCLLSKAVKSTLPNIYLAAIMWQTYFLSRGVYRRMEETGGASQILIQIPASHYTFQGLRRERVMALRGWQQGPILDGSILADLRELIDFKQFVPEIFISTPFLNLWTLIPLGASNSPFTHQIAYASLFHIVSQQYQNCSYEATTK